MSMSTAVHGASPGCVAERNEGMTAPGSAGPGLEPAVSSTRSGPVSHRAAAAAAAPPSLPRPSPPSRDRRCGGVS